MKVFLLKDNTKVAKLKRLINLKADLGLCEWNKDFEDTDLDISSLIERIDAKLDNEQNNCDILKEFTADEDMKYFDSVNFDETTKSILGTGIIDNNGKNLLGENCPALLKDVIDKVDEIDSVWIV